MPTIAELNAAIEAGPTRIGPARGPRPSWVGDKAITVAGTHEILCRCADCRVARSQAARANIPVDTDR